MCVPTCWGTDNGPKSKKTLLAGNRCRRTGPKQCGLPAHLTPPLGKLAHLDLPSGITQLHSVECQAEDAVWLQPELQPSILPVFPFRLRGGFSTDPSIPIRLSSSPLPRARTIAPVPCSEPARFTRNSPFPRSARSHQTRFAPSAEQKSEPRPFVSRETQMWNIPKSRWRFVRRHRDIQNRDFRDMDVSRRH